MKAFFIIALLLIFSLCSFAQPFEGGFFAGASLSQVEGDDNGGYNKVGFTAGGYLVKEINRKSNWKAELRYIQKGAYHKATDEDPNLYILTTHYVDIPLMYQYHVNEKVILEAGISPDIYLYHREKDEYGVLEMDDQPEYHRFGLSAHAGAGYALSDHLTIAARLSYNILPMRDHASGQTYLLNRGQYNNVISFSLYYHLR